MDGNLEDSRSLFFAGIGSNTTLELGYPTSSMREFDGRLDDVSVYNRDLTAAEIQSQFAARSTLPLEPFDQRGTGFSRLVGGMIDIGSVEANPPVVRTLGTIPSGHSTQPAYDLRAGEVAFYRLQLAADVTAANGSVAGDRFTGILTDDKQRY